MNRKVALALPSFLFALASVVPGADAGSVAPQAAGQVRGVLAAVEFQDRKDDMVLLFGRELRIHAQGQDFVGYLFGHREISGPVA